MARSQLQQPKETHNNNDTSPHKGESDNEEGPGPSSSSPPSLTMSSCTRSRSRNNECDNDDDDDGVGLEVQQQQQQHPHSQKIKKNKKKKQKQLHIAPMLDVSTREFRYLMRILSKECIIWTEMIVSETLAFCKESDYDHHLGYDLDVDEDEDMEEEDDCINQEEKEEDIVDNSSNSNSNRFILQLGSNDPQQTRKAIEIIQRNERYADGYLKNSEINLNMDCPSNRVAGKREFGAVLMKPNKLDVAVNVVKAMKEQLLAVSEGGDDCSNGNGCDVSIKCRIGVDEDDSYEYMIQLIDKLYTEADCTIFHLHARKCLLGGILTPIQNRKIPPLLYPRIYALCRKFPQCTFTINGGIPSLKVAKNICYSNSSGGSSSSSSSSNEGSNTCGGTNLHLHTGDGTPCNICNKPNGSCVATPHETQGVYETPQNLIGCMVGRLAMDNPCSMWDVDRYFYNMPQNPCTNRRQVLEKYISYLERIYPKRCCDTNDNVTSRAVVVVADDERHRTHPTHCSICEEFYQADYNHRQRQEHDDNDDVAVPSSNVASSSSTMTTATNGDTTSITKAVKISTNVIYRALKPILGIFFGLPKSKKFRYTIDKLTHNVEVRNCGPGYILRKALQLSIPDDMLDMPFVKTEDLNDDDIPLHNGGEWINNTRPSTNNNNNCSSSNGGEGDATNRKGRRGGHEKNGCDGSTNQHATTTTSSTKTTSSPTRTTTTETSTLSSPSHLYCDPCCSNTSDGNDGET